ncbi:MAG TPA: single-stranded DNA-binding protein [Ornithinicoccus sp.]|nr:single-stranded DNA-binding protein [Ornithinicoccus sp.]
MTTKTQEPESARLVNTVLLVGRVSAAPESRAMPSGDELVQFRLVVPRPEVRGQTRTPVDTIDIACWSARSRGSAGRLQKGDIIEVEGSLRRRFFAGASGRASRYEVEARRLRRLARPA